MYSQSVLSIANFLIDIHVTERQSALDKLLGISAKPRGTSRPPRSSSNSPLDASASYVDSSSSYLGGDTNPWDFIEEDPPSPKSVDKSHVDLDSDGSQYSDNEEGLEEPNSRAVQSLYQSLGSNSPEWQAFAASLKESGISLEKEPTLNSVRSLCMTLAPDNPVWQTITRSLRDSRASWAPAPVVKSMYMTLGPDSPEWQLLSEVLRKNSVSSVGSGTPERRGLEVSIEEDDGSDYDTEREQAWSDEE